MSLGSAAVLFTKRPLQLSPKRAHSRQQCGGAISDLSQTSFPFAARIPTNQRAACSPGPSETERRSKGGSVDMAGAARHLVARGGR